VGVTGSDQQGLFRAAGAAISASDAGIKDRYWTAAPRRRRRAGVSGPPTDGL